MAEVRWTIQAVEDLEAIATFIARDSPRDAANLVAKVLRAVERIQSFPMAGRMVPEVGRQSIREVIVGAYRVIYRVQPHGADILTVHHGARILRTEW